MRKIFNIFKVLGDERRDVVLLILSGIALVLSLGNVRPFHFDASWVAVLLSGIPIVVGAGLALLKEFDIRADVLVSLALLSSLAVGEIFAAGEIAFIMQLGAFLEKHTVHKAQQGLASLVALTPSKARRICGEKEEEILATTIRQGDVLRVLPGEKIPADGKILSGKTAVDQAILTGESLPVDKSEGDEVFAGTLNQFGAVTMRAEKSAADTSLSRMIRLVQSADAGKAKIVRLADRWATWIVVAALVTAFSAWFFTGEILRAVTVLVVFCPCALVLATPTAVMAAIGNATRHGFLVKEGDALERLASVTQIVFDKTGTLTAGKPQVVAVESFVSMYSNEEILAITAQIEQYSEHPLGKAVVQAWKAQGVKISSEILQGKETVQAIPGEGVLLQEKDTTWAAGNRRLLARLQVNFKDMLTENAGESQIFLAKNGQLIGRLALADTPRAEAFSTLTELKSTGITPVLLTGDNQSAACKMAQKLGVEKVFADCLPEDKMKYIAQAQKNGVKTLMVGDGVNDAPALKKAFASVAMGAKGSDIAMEAADIALVQDNLRALPHLLRLSRRMMQTIRYNLTFSLGLNFIAIFLAVTGEMGPVTGALVHNAGSAIVVINASLLLRL